MMEALPEIRLISDTAMFVLIWMVQLIIYPAFKWIDASTFKAWHHRYTKTMGFVVTPLIIIQSISLGLQISQGASCTAIQAAGAILIALLVTATQSVPCHKALQDHGKKTELIEHLVRTNWIRTLCWTIPFTLSSMQYIGLYGLRSV
jgi:hypothetical protein